MPVRPEPDFTKQSNWAPSLPGEHSFRAFNEISERVKFMSLHELLEYSGWQRLESRSEGRLLD